MNLTVKVSRAKPEQQKVAKNRRKENLNMITKKNILMTMKTLKMTIREMRVINDALVLMK